MHIFIFFLVYLFFLFNGNRKKVFYFPKHLFFLPLMAQLASIFLSTELFRILEQHICIHQQTNWTESELRENTYKLALFIFWKWMNKWMNEWMKGRERKVFSLYLVSRGRDWEEVGVLTRTQKSSHRGMAEKEQQQDKFVHRCKTRNFDCMSHYSLPSHCK